VPLLPVSSSFFPATLRRWRPNKYRSGSSGNSSGAKIEDVMEKKVVSDISAYIRSYVEKRGRNARWPNWAL
jgi:hypothetical protein